jgi:chemotaxis protein histidine kinase CheA
VSVESEMQGARNTFVIECRDLVQEMEDAFLGIETEPDPTELIHAVFRAAHTIKGSAGLFGLNHLVRFTHVVEGVLDRLREGVIGVNTELIGKHRHRGDRRRRSGSPGDSRQSRGARARRGPRQYQRTGDLRARLRAWFLHRGPGV